MLYPSINEIRKKADSRYTVAILAAKRARDLIDGKPALTDDANCDRPVSIAAWEVSEDLITYARDESAMDSAQGGALDEAHQVAIHFDAPEADEITEPSDEEAIEVPQEEPEEESEEESSEL